VTSVDASYFIALLDPDDRNHSRALEVDCVTFVVMGKLRIRALAFDSEFGHRFILRAGPG
jgi:predicted nucleic acid-binding protein